MNILEYAAIRKMVGGGGGGSGESVIVLNGNEITANDFATAKYRVNCPVAGKIEAGAFTSSVNLTSAYCPVATTIGSDAFSGCINLTSIYCPVASWIGNDAFYGCTSLTSINIPVTHYIQDSAFYGCTSLTSVNAPMVDSISKKAFLGCTSLTSVNFSKIGIISNNAFSNCTALTTVSLDFDASIDDRVVIASGAFGGCTNLSALILRTSGRMLNVDLTAILDTKIATAEGVPTGEGFIYVERNCFEDYVANFVVQITTGFGLDEATAGYMARAILRKIEDYPEICGG